MRTLLTKLAGTSLSEVVRSGPGFVREQTVRWGSTVYYRRQLHGDRARRIARRQAAADRMTDAETVLFLCHGNICRSPFAERYARSRLQARGIEEIAVSSAGLSRPGDPRSPPAARRAARSWGVSLDDHRAVQVDQESIERVAIVFVMDYRNYIRVRRRFPTVADRVYFLRLFADGATMTIEDPHGAGVDAHETAYDVIGTCVERLLATTDDR